MPIFQSMETAPNKTKPTRVTALVGMQLIDKSRHRLKRKKNEKKDEQLWILQSLKKNFSLTNYIHRTMSTLTAGF